MMRDLIKLFPDKGLLRCRPKRTVCNESAEIRRFTYDNARAIKGGIERRVEQIVTQAPGNVEGVAPRGPRPRPGTDLADWQPLAADTWYNETQRRLLIHDRLADTTSVRPEQMKRWLYKEVLHADLDDPYLGLGDALFGDDVFRQDQ